MIRTKTLHHKPTIDLDGPAGNAFALLGQAKSLAHQLGFTSAETQTIVNEMRSSNYSHLIATFDKYFGTYVDLIRSAPEEE